MLLTLGLLQQAATDEVVGGFSQAGSGIRPWFCDLALAHHCRSGCPAFATGAFPDRNRARIAAGQIFGSADRIALDSRPLEAGEGNFDGC